MYQFMWYAPGMGKGAAGPYIGTILQPISSNIQQDENNAPVAGVESTMTSIPMPPVDSKPVDAGPSGTVMLSTAGITSQGSPDQPAPLRHGTQTTWNLLPWRYQNFGLLADTVPSSISDAMVHLFVCLHVISYLYTIFWGSTV